MLGQAAPHVEARTHDPAFSSAARFRLVRRVLWVTLALNLLVAGVKILVGILAANLTVVADGFHSLLDGANNVIGLVAISLASRPADREHPYGHRKFEHVAAMLLGGLVFFLCFQVFQRAGVRLWEMLRGTTEVTGMTEPIPLLFFLVVGAGMVINLLVSRYEMREGNRLNSSLLRADARHTMSDAAITLTGLLSLAASRSIPWIDPVLAIGVGCFLFYAALSILMENVATMTDRNRLDPAEVREVAEGVGGVLNAHAIRSHGMENDIHLDLHILVPPSLRASEVTRIEEQVRSALMEHFPGCISRIR